MVSSPSARHLGASGIGSTCLSRLASCPLSLVSHLMVPYPLFSMLSSFTSNSYY